VKHDLLVPRQGLASACQPRKFALEEVIGQFMDELVSSAAVIYLLASISVFLNDGLGLCIALT
jgi:hypothetical protein